MIFSIYTHLLIVNNAFLRALYVIRCNHAGLCDTVTICNSQKTSKTSRARSLGFGRVYQSVGFSGEEVKFDTEIH